MSCCNLSMKIFDQNLFRTFETVAKCILITAVSWLDLELKRQGHRKNQKPIAQGANNRSQKQSRDSISNRWATGVFKICNE